MPAHPALPVAKAETGLITPVSPLEGRRQTRVAPSPSSVRATCKAFSAMSRSLLSSLARSSSKAAGCLALSVSILTEPVYIGSSA